VPDIKTPPLFVKNNDPALLLLLSREGLPPVLSDFRLTSGEEKIRAPLLLEEG
jgi:hypothetical protein